ncbi:MAG: hypothetical protein HY720_18170 [Planctomycetes bacterium]|nr:hypothetical protein [Planctomycetota bacterium]
MTSRTWKTLAGALFVLGCVAPDPARAQTLHPDEWKRFGPAIEARLKEFARDSTPSARRIAELRTAPGILVAAIRPSAAECYRSGLSPEAER